METNKIYMIIFGLGKDKVAVLARIEGKVVFPSKGKWPLAPNAGEAWEVKVEKELEKVAFISPVSGPYFSAPLGVEGIVKGRLRDILGEPDVTWATGDSFGKPTFSGVWIRYSLSAAQAMVKETVARDNKN